MDDEELTELGFYARVWVICLYLEYRVIRWLARDMGRAVLRRAKLVSASRQNPLT